MASMAFSTTFFTPLQHRTTSSSLPPTLIKSSSLASSNSPFFLHAFSQQTSFYPLLKSRSFSVNARAITDKTIYDFTVKVLSYHLQFSIFYCSHNLILICSCFEGVNLVWNWRKKN
jgi:glutathione peroxidase